MRISSIASVLYSAVAKLCSYFTATTKKVETAADTVFKGEAGSTVVYNLDQLKVGASIHNFCPSAFRGKYQGGYHRHCAQLGLSKQAAEVVDPSALCDKIIQKEYRPSKTSSAFSCLAENVRLKNTPALQISATLLQLGDDSDVMASLSEEQRQIFKEFDGFAKPVFKKTGEIKIQQSNEFSIEEDYLVIEDMKGQEIAKYRVDSKFKISPPDSQGSVTCSVTRSFQKVQPSKK